MVTSVRGDEARKVEGADGTADAVKRREVVEVLEETSIEETSVGAMLEGIVSAA